jgi:hypothetical protein
MKLLKTTTMLALSALVLSASGTACAEEKLKLGETETKEEKKCTSYSFKFSGYFKADYSFDQARVSPGNYALKVLQGPEDEVTSMTARETRIGFDFNWADNGIRSAAKLEFDFYGLGASPASLNSMENKAAPMLRHAYLKLTKGHWSVLAGQTSDVISPLVPKTVNYTVGWAQGNIGYRRPQFRLSAWTGLGSGKLTASVAATRTIGHDLDQDWIEGSPDSLIGTGDGIDDGADSPIPTFQGRLGLETDIGVRGHAAIGVSGHFGREEAKITTYDLAGGVLEKGSRELESWSFNIDLKLKLSDRVNLSGEYFMGQNLGAYLGGVLQDYSPTFNEIGAMGGWGMISLVPVEKAVFNIGYCFDDPDEEDFIIPDDSSGSMINMNSVFFGNIMYSVTKNVTAMIEGSYLKTTYLQKTVTGGVADSTELDYDSIRVQVALKAAIM